jgi:outer membrane protein
VASVAVLSVGLLVAGCQTREAAVGRPQTAQTLGPTLLQQEAPSVPEFRIEAEELQEEPVGSDWPLAAEGGLTLSLEEAVFLALRNNRELSLQELSPVIAGTFEELERAVYDPRVYLEGGLSRSQGERLSPEIGQRLVLESEGAYLEGGVAQEFATGTTVEAGLRQNWSTTGLTPDQHSLRAGLSVTQSLLQGGRREANLARIQQARIDARISEYELRGFTEALVNQVETSYWNYSLARQQVEIFERSLEVAQRQRGEAEERVEVGALPRTELAAVRAEEARRRQDLIGARARFDQARIVLLRQMNPATRDHWETPVVVAPASGMVDARLDPVHEHVMLALRMRPDLNEARLRVDRGELEVVRTRNGLLPRLDLFLNLGKTGYADSFSDAVRDIDGRSYDVSGGFRFLYPIGNRAARAGNRIATLGRYQTGLALENLAQLVEADIRSAYLEVGRAREQIAATAVTRELQEEVLRAEEVRFDAGVSTALLVAQAQRDLLAAQLDEVQAVVDYRQALTNLYRLEGSLLMRRGIHAPGVEPIAE